MEEGGVAIGPLYAPEGWRGRNNRVAALSVAASRQQLAYDFVAYAELALETRQAGAHDACLKAYAAFLRDLDGNKIEAMVFMKAG